MAEWRAAASDTFGQLRLSPNTSADAFRVDLSTANVGDIRLFNMKTPAHRVEKLSSMIDDNERPYCKLSLQIKGDVIMKQDGRECTIRPGELGLYVTHRPYELEFPDDQESMIVLFPQEFVQLPGRMIREITAMPITASEGLGRVAIPLFEQLALNFEVLTGPHAGPLLRSSLDMLVTAISADMDEKADAPDFTLLDSINKYIDHNLGDPALGPRSIAEAMFVSVRHVHSQFAESDTTVSAYIRQRRLEHIRRDIANPLHHAVSIQQIGARYGMPDASQLSRAFKAEYKESPSAFRKQALGD